MSARTWLCTWLSPAARASIAADSPAVDSRKLATISFAVTPGAVAPPLLPEKVVAHGPLCDHLTWRCAQLTLTFAGPEASEVAPPRTDPLAPLPPATPVPPAPDAAAPVVSPATGAPPPAPPVPAPAPLPEAALLKPPVSRGETLGTSAINNASVSRPTM